MAGRVHPAAGPDLPLSSVDEEEGPRPLAIADREGPGDSAPRGLGGRARAMRAAATKLFRFLTAPPPREEREYREWCAGTGGSHLSYA